ncbi:hypothetical protein bas27_0084 [Escherichia phage TrudiGerster]|uniref:Uncharacterized protein n=1 Tax=Escherichia phage TrudiGerster TaxID=2851991 RepID=A0AAE8B587_9CAUD|nr:hypothetical protein bas27_0084 [Escherichia phage TrudiGerster]
MKTRYIVKAVGEHSQVNTTDVTALAFEVVSGIVIFHNGDIKAPEFAVDSGLFISATKVTVVSNSSK